MLFLLLLLAITACAGSAPQVEVSPESLEKQRLEAKLDSLEVEEARLQLMLYKQEILLNAAVEDSTTIALMVRASEYPLYSDEFNRYMREVCRYTVQKRVEQYLIGTSFTSASIPASAYNPAYAYNLGMSFVVAQAWDIDPEDVLERMAITDEEKRRVLRAASIGKGP